MVDIPHRTVMQTNGAVGDVMLPVALHAKIQPTKAILGFSAEAVVAFETHCFSNGWSSTPYWRRCPAATIPGARSELRPSQMQLLLTATVAAAVTMIVPVVLRAVAHF
jgi:hypothetical protein